LFGLNVYTDSGTFVGKVSDVLLNVEAGEVSGIAVSNINRKLFDVPTRGVILPYRWVITSGDIVLIRDVVSRFQKKNKDDEE
jgi:sporulation protein YlmC with PRC-barrel domain